MLAAAGLIVGVLVALAWTALAARAVRLARGLRLLRPIEGPVAPDLPLVEAIVPARNEADGIAATVAALRAQEYPDLRLIVVDDRSTDATGAILDDLAAVEPKLQIIHGVPRPEGWVGKTWAVAQGVAASRAEWLWFVDADMGLHPRALATALHVAETEGADLVTFAPRADCTTFWQGTIALALTELLMQLYPVDRVNDPARPEAMAVGGFILVRRSAYERAGGHEAVRAEIVEDIALGRRVKAGGGRLALRVAPDLAWTPMYGSFGAIWRGLRKNAYAGMDYMPHKYVVGAIVALTLAWASPLLAVAGVASLSRGPGWWAFAALGVGLWGWLAMAVAATPPRVFLRLPWPMALSLPAGITAYVAIATASVWHHHRGRILWKDVVFATTAVQSAGRPGPGPAGAARAGPAESGPGPAADPAPTPGQGAR